MPAKKRIAILVLGPPRSGTSAVSHVLNELGVDFGDPDRFLDTEKHRHNPIFFELSTLNELNDEIFGYFNAEYLDGFLPDKNSFNDDLLSGFTPKIKAFIKREFAKASIIGLKDPRFCFTLPLWISALKEMKFSIKIVFVFRPVSAVISSNKSINQWSRSRNASIWLQSILAARYFLEDQEFVTADYVRLVQNPDNEVRALATQLGLSTRNVSKAKKVINPDHRHFRSIRKTEFQYLNTIYDHLKGFELNPDEYLHFRELHLTAISNKEDQITKLQSIIKVAEEQNKSVRNELDNIVQIKDKHIVAQENNLENLKRIVEKNLADQADQLTGAQSVIEALESQLAAKSDFLVDAEGVIDKKEKFIADQADQLTGAQSVIEALESQLAAKSDFLVDAEGVIDKKEKFIADQAGQLTGTQSVIEALESQLAAQSDFLADAEGVIDKKEKFIADQAGQLSSAQSMIEDLESQLAERNSYLADLAAAVKEKNTKISDLDHQVLSLRTEVTDIDGAYQELKDSYERSFLRKVRRLGGRVIHSGLWPARAIATLVRKIIKFSPSNFATKLKTNRLISNTCLFDHNYYLKTYPDVQQAGIQPLSHYVSHGAAEGRDPHPLFDSSFYLEQNPDVKSAGINPLAHYIRSGAAEGRDPHPLFDSSYYLEQNPDFKSANLNPLAHYLTDGAALGCNPNPHFDSSFYNRNNPDVAEYNFNPLVHYLSTGAIEGRDPSPGINSIKYFEDNPDIEEHGINPLAHIISSGLPANYQNSDPGKWSKSTLLGANPVSEKPRFAVVYLSRFGDQNHEQLIKDFIESYKRYKAGIAHDLVIVFKNYGHYRDLNRVKNYLRDINYIELRMPDVDYDIGAYSLVAKNLNHDYMLFLNSYSHFLDNRWLKKMAKYVQLPDVGVVSTTGSYESLYSSIKLLLRVSRVVKPDARLKYYFSYCLPNLFGQEMPEEESDDANKINLTSKLRLILSQVTWNLKLKAAMNEMRIGLTYTANSIKIYWRLFNWRIGHFKRSSSLLAHFPAYPNPHIRSNAFMISRARFVELISSTKFTTKYDSSYFESGRSSMTNRLLKQNLKVLVVGKNGVSYEIDEWPTSATFRQGEQQNLLIGDNRTRESVESPEGYKILLTKMTWGDCLPDMVEDLPLYGIKFSSSSS